jgi:integrase
MVTKIGLYKDLRNKNKPWVVRWYGEYDPAIGKRRRYSRAFRLKVEAEKFQADKIQEFGQGSQRDRASKVTLGSFCRDWLEARKPDLKPATHDLYCYIVRRLESHFGNEALLQDITPKDAVVFISMQKNMVRGCEDKPLSDWTREQIKKYSKLVFDAAVKWSLIPANPFDVLRFKKLAIKRWHRVTPVEYHALLEAAPTLRWKTFYALAYTSGARMAELFSLTWNDMDFENSRLIISNRRGTADMPPFHVKDHEARNIPLPPHTIDLLTEWQAQAPEAVPYILLTKERYNRVRAKWQKLQNQRKPWRNRYMVNNVLREFKRHSKHAGIRPVGSLTVHTLRKSCGQNWADHLPMNVVKELMGHSKAETTLEYYSQVDKDHEEKAARVVQKMIESARRSKKADVRLTYKAPSHHDGGVA